ACGGRSAAFPAALHPGVQAHLPPAFDGGVGLPGVADRSAGPDPDGSIRRVLLFVQLRDELVQRVELLLELLPSRLGPHGSGLRYERLKRVLSLLQTGAGVIAWQDFLFCLLQVAYLVQGQSFRPLVDRVVPDSKLARVAPVPSVLLRCPVPLDASPLRGGVHPLPAFPAVEDASQERGFCSELRPRIVLLPSLDLLPLRLGHYPIPGWDRETVVPVHGLALVWEVAAERRRFEEVPDAVTSPGSIGWLSALLAGS